MANRENLTEVARYDGIPCPDCGSKNNVSVYEKEDEECEKHYDGICWGVCSANNEGFKSAKWLEENGILDELGKENTRSAYKGGSKVDYTEQLEEISTYDSRGVRERRIKKKYAEMYGMKVGYDTETGESITEHYYPVTKDGEVTGYFKRELPKKFSAIGDVKDCQLQGQHLFDRGGEYEHQCNRKFIIITEGFLDALATFQMLQEYNPKYITPVVSLPNGANPKALVANAQFLERFDTILLAFDQDKAGKDNAKKCAKVFKSGKVKIMSFSEKDPSDMLKNHLTEDKDGNKRDLVTEFARSFWDSAEHRPSQILTVSDIAERAMKLPEMGLSFPWSTATEKTLGIRRGEVHIVGAAPKIG